MWASKLPGKVTHDNDIAPMSRPGQALMMTMMIWSLLGIDDTATFEIVVAATMCLLKHICLYAYIEQC